MLKKNVGEGFSTWQKNVGEGWSEINPFTPRDTIKNGIALRADIGNMNITAWRSIGLFPKGITK